METPGEAGPRAEARPSPPSGHASAQGAPTGAAALEANVRFVEVVERADLAHRTRGRVARADLVPADLEQGQREEPQVVRRDGARPSAAVLVEQDARIELVGADASVRLTIRPALRGQKFGTPADFESATSTIPSHRR